MKTTRQRRMQARPGVGGCGGDSFARASPACGSARVDSGAGIGAANVNLGFSSGLTPPVNGSFLGLPRPGNSDRTMCVVSGPWGGLTGARMGCKGVNDET